MKYEGMDPVEIALEIYGENRRDTMAEVHVGDEVYYTGDMANDSAWLKVSCTGPTNIGMVEGGVYGGRVFNVQPSNIGGVYQGHCNPRFVTKQAYNEYRERMGFSPRA